MKTISAVFRACIVFAPAAFLLFYGRSHAAELTNATDYSMASHWMFVPEVTNKAVDVFYLYPTAWANTNSNPEICAIDEPSMRQQAPVAAAHQVTAFEPIGNIYAPFYRQDNNSPIDRLAIIAGIPTTDATAAFDYYLKNYNNGRPFILAGHSQGSDVLSNLLADYVKCHPEVQVRMIVAYVIGFPITAEYLSNNPHLKFAETSNDTGVIVSYNTQSPAVPPGGNPILSGMTGVVINPILWTRDTTLATTNRGFGSYMPNSNGVYERGPQYADAQVNITNGVLICSTADTNALGQISGLAAYGIFHNFDYPFYYYNLRSNAAERVQIFLNQYYAADVCADYDGDRKADPALYMGVAGNWYVKLSGSGYPLVILPFGGDCYQAVSCDFDGDGLADPAIYQAAPLREDATAGQAGKWKIALSGSGYAVTTLNGFGGAGWVAAAADYDGDGKSDPAIYNETNGNWQVQMSSQGYALAAVSGFGGANYSAVQQNYDSECRADTAIYNETNGNWTILLSAQHSITATLWGFGGAGYAPVRGDFDGDGLADPTVYQEPGGNWYVKLSGQGYATVTLAGFGGTGRLAASPDFDGDGKADPTLFDPATGLWHIKLSASGYIEAILASGWTPQSPAWSPDLMEHSRN